MSWKKILLIVVGVTVVSGVGTGWYLITYAELDVYAPMYADNCSSCHGADMSGGDGGGALVGTPLAGGDAHEALQRSIRDLHPTLNGFVGTLDDPMSITATPENSKQIFASEARAGTVFAPGFKMFYRHATENDGTPTEPKIHPAPYIVAG